MQPPQHDHPINLEDLSAILCAVAIRAGDFLSLDVLATMSPLQRVMHAVKTANESPERRSGGRQGAERNASSTPTED
ncbi:hypothetical protein ACTMU2_14445 [Cupriavidus basilensis]